MSSTKIITYVDYEMIYSPNINEPKMYFEKNYDNNIIFEMIYKPYENKKELEEKNEKLKKLKEEYNFSLDDEKEYTEDAIRIFGKYFVKHNKHKCKIIYNNKKYFEYFGMILIYINIFYLIDIRKIKINIFKNLQTNNLY